MAADFPSAIANINRPTANTKRNAPGYEGHALHAKLADEIEAIEGVIGVTGSTVPTSIEYRLEDVRAVADAAESTLSRVSPLILESAVTYDALGRVSVANGWTYTYSASGLLASATDGTYTRTYTYDSSGRYTGFTEV